MKELTDTSQPQRINVRRSDIFDDAISAIGKPTFHLKRNLKVRFLGEPAVDEGGPRREFFRLLYNAMGQSSAMFQMLPNGRGITLNHNIPSLAAGRYATCGTIPALGLLYGTEAPNCFSNATADFLVYGSVNDPSPIEMLQSLPDYEVQVQLVEVSFWQQ